MKRLKVIEHLKELRERIIKSLIFLFFSFIFLHLFISEKIINNLLEKYNLNIISLNPYDFFIARFKLSLYSSLIISLPYFLFQTFLFIKPGLNKKERKIFTSVLILFILIYVSSLLLTYHFLMPITFNYFIYYNQRYRILNLWSATQIINFIFLMYFSSLLILLIPIVLIILKKFSVINEKILSKYRRHFYIFSLFISALITPPDVLSQIIFACPMILLFELSLLILRFVR